MSCYLFRKESWSYLAVSYLVNVREVYLGVGGEIVFSEVIAAVGDVEDIRVR